MALSVGSLLVLIRLGVIRTVPAADVEPLDLASLMLGASSLVVTGVGIAVAIGAFFGFELLRDEARKAGREAGELAGRESGQVAGAREASIAAKVTDPRAVDEGAEIAAVQPPEPFRE